ncbi:hypothetical protein [Companilactobacillus musae]|uniref:hypothetical protein n=1 Tax=Companilactobacillus musae TaxID=1903258 RepID=UPI000E651523|nr:hypothetical protein [Companilactobacillus musae]
MENKVKVIEVMEKFANELKKYHPNFETTKYVQETLLELKKSEGVAFTGKLQYFFNRVLVVKLSDGIKFNESEKRYWKELSSFVELGNNLWGASL